MSVNKDIKRLWEKSVISSVTYYGMHLGAIGFLGYCKYMLEMNPDLKCIPVLRANTSSLQSDFSLMRWYDADTPGKYESTFNIVDNEKWMNHLQKIQCTQQTVKYI